MAIDTKQKRMSAMNPRCPWRGPRVYAPDAGFQVSKRRAALFSYSLVDLIRSGALKMEIGARLKHVMTTGARLKHMMTTGSNPEN